jgi:hypothetical protein
MMKVKRRETDIEKIMDNNNDNGWSSGIFGIL